MTDIYKSKPCSKPQLLAKCTELAKHRFLALIRELYWIVLMIIQIMQRSIVLCSPSSGIIIVVLITILDTPPTLLSVGD